MTRKSSGVVILKRELKRIRIAEYTEDKVRNLLYRPFTKSHLFFDRIMNDEVSHFPSIFPTHETESENRVICVPSKALEAANHFKRASCNNHGPESLTITSIDGNPMLSVLHLRRRRHEPTDKRTLPIGHWRNSEPTTTMPPSPNGTSSTITTPSCTIPPTREKYEMNLKRDLPHIPFAEDFWGFANAGTALADLHVNYESAPKYDELKYIETPGMPIDWRVEKMKLSKDKTQLKYNDFLMLDGIPAEAFGYRLGTRSALEWVVDQYRVKIDKRSGIRNDPNRADQPRYIVDLIGRVITVSLRTVEIVEMPAL